MSTVNSREKGASAERKLAEVLRGYGWDGAKRGGNQYSGGGSAASGKADLVGIPGLHVECKHWRRAGAADVYEWVAQSETDAKGSGEVPVAIWKTNNRKWLVTQTLSQEWVDMMSAYLATRKGSPAMPAYNDVYRTVARDQALAALILSELKGSRAASDVPESVWPLLEAIAAGIPQPDPSQEEVESDV